jgi:hypothetical protein
MENIRLWKEIRKSVEVETAMEIYKYIMNDENKWLKVSDFEKPTIVTILDFKKVTGGKYVNKWGYSNQLTVLYSNIERAIDNSSYAFQLAFKNSGLRSGDRAMIVTVGFTDPLNSQPYRYWIMEKLETSSKEEQAL